MNQSVNGIDVEKKWFSDGATMLHPVRVRTIYWGINLALYILLLMFDLRLRTGNWLPGRGPVETIHPLIHSLLSPLNIFQFPLQILVMGMIMALICTVPLLTSLLYNLWYALPFVAVVVMISSNAILALCLLVSCAALSFRPFRFKSKFVAIVLWLSPEVLYWILYSGNDPEQDVLRWAVLYAPWAVALFNCLLISGIVIAVGHFLRYRPGVLMPLFGLILAITVLFFHLGIGMDQRDYQSEVFRNSPAQIKEFRSRSITPLIEQEAAERLKEEPYLNPQGVEDEIRMIWRWAFNLGPSQRKTEVFAYQMARYNAIFKIKRFVSGMPQANPYIADALYNLALLYDLRVDLRSLRDDDMLRFYYDRPQRPNDIDASWELLYDHIRQFGGVDEPDVKGDSTEESTGSSAVYWHELYSRFPESRVSIEARWRLAWLMATQKPSEPGESYRFDDALALLNEAQQRCEAAIAADAQEQEREGFWDRHLGKIFTPPPKTLPHTELTDLRRRIGTLILLLGPENRTGHLQHEERLATFISLDPHQLDYEEQLNALAEQATHPDPLADNIELAQILLIRDNDQRRLRLLDLVSRNPRPDGGPDGELEGRMELALLLLEERQRSEHLADRQELLTEAQKQLQYLVAARPDTYLARRAAELLQQNPME